MERGDDMAAGNMPASLDAVQTGRKIENAIISWSRLRTLPSIDNLYMLSRILEVPMDELLVPSGNGKRPG